MIKSCSRTVDLEKEQFPDFEKQKEEMNLKMEEINNILNEALQVIFFLENFMIVEFDTKKI